MKPKRPTADQPPAGATILLSTLHPNPQNPRTISESAFAKLVASVKAFPRMMELRPIVVGFDGTILGGNMRFRAITEGLGMTECPASWVVKASDLTPEQVQRFIIADNAPEGASGAWDWDSLANQFEISDLKEWGFDEKELLDAFADDAGTADAEAQMDKAAELNKKWGVKTGDLFKIGEHRLLAGDSTLAADVARVMGGEKAICVFTDPPYGVSVGKKNIMLNTFQKAGMCLTSLASDDLPPAELGEMLLKVFTLWREQAMSDQCAVFVCSPQGGGLGMMMMMMMMNAGLEVRHILNWIKNCPTFSMGRLDYDYQHEPILFTWTKTHKRKKAGAFQTSLWTVNKPMANKEHPTMKPIELPTCAILNHTDPGDVVVDMFGGSGTTMIAAENTKRVCRMVEKDENFCAVILDRMSRAFPGITITKESADVAAPAGPRAASATQPASCTAATVPGASEGHCGE